MSGIRSLAEARLGLGDISDRQAVLDAVAEFDRLGRATFLARHGYQRAYNYFLAVGGKLYDSKAIVGMAHGYQFPDQGPLRSSEFSGGWATVKRKLEELGFEVAVLNDSGARPQSHWWDDLPEERSWVEIRNQVAGLGVELRCPFLDVTFDPNGWYDLVDEVRPDDVIYHWNGREERFVGRSIAEGRRETDSETGERIVSLNGFTPLQVDVGLPAIRNAHSDLERIRDELARTHPRGSHYLPFQFRRDGLRLMSNYFAKLPLAMQQVLFGADGLAEADLDEPPPEEGPAAPRTSEGVRSTFLKPFRRKADTHYLAHVQGGRHRRGRSHETLVNGFASWLEGRGFLVGRNAAIDLGVEDPPVIIEAKQVVSWAKAIREAVGQLYEYRFFQVVAPESRLVFLASTAIPNRWLEYLEQDRGIGGVWPAGDDFAFSRLASQAFEMEWSSGQIESP